MGESRQESISDGNSAQVLLAGEGRWLPRVVMTHERDAISVLGPRAERGTTRSQRQRTRMEENTGHNLSCCWELVHLGAAGISRARLVGELWRACPCV